MVAILCCGGCGGCGSPTAPPVRRDPKAEAEFKKLAEVNSVDLSRLVGSWQVVTRFDNGEQTRKGVGKVITITPDHIAADGTTWRYWIDASREPKEIYIIESGNDPTAYGIYGWSDDKLQMHLARKLQARPASFDPEYDAQDVELVVYKKIAAQP